MYNTMKHEKETRHNDERFTFFPRSSINSFWIVSERCVVMPLLESWKPVTERCSLMIALYFASNFKVSRKFPWFLELESSRWPRKGRFCLHRNFMTSTHSAGFLSIYFLPNP